MFGYYFDLALRSFRRNKMLTALMVIAIALGIGACMTTLTVFHVLSGDPIPQKSDRLYYPRLEPRPMRGFTPGDEPQEQMTRFDAEELLRQAAGEGRIDIDELDERLEATYAAKTYADLVPITADLVAPAQSQDPRVVPRPAAPLVPGTTYDNSVAFMSETKRQGPWLVPPQHSAFAMMGSVVLDLREAEFTARDIKINAVSLMAGIDIIVNAHTAVVIDGFGLMGDFSESKAKVPPQLTAESPVVRVKGLALMGAVNVKRKPMPGQPRRRLGWSK